MRTLLIAAYASFVFSEGGTPESGGGKAVMKVRSAVVGTELSTELVSLMLDTL